MATVAASDSVGYWLGTIVNTAYQEGQHAFTFGAGIGERVYKTDTAPKEGTREAALRSANWIKNMAKIDIAADLEGFNVVAIAPRWKYESGEFRYAVKYAREFLKCGKITALNNSLGQFGFSQEASKDPELPKLFDNLIGFVTGDGMTTNTAKNIADAKLPCLFITCENDIASYTNPTATIKLHKAILAAGGISWLICLKAGQYTDLNAHQIISVIGPMLYDGKGKKLGDVGAVATDTPLGEKGIKNVITKMSMSIYDWAKLNSKENAVAPDYVDPVPEVPPVEETPDAPAPEVPEEPEVPVQKLTIMNANMNSEHIKNGAVMENNNTIQIVWSDSSTDQFKAPAGFRCAGIWMKKDAEKNDIFTMDIVRVGSREKGEAIIIGPFKK